MLVTAHGLQMGEQPPATVTSSPLRGELCWTRPLEPGVAGRPHGPSSWPHTGSQLAAVPARAIYMWTQAVQKHGRPAVWAVTINTGYLASCPAPLGRRFLLKKPQDGAKPKLDSFLKSVPERHDQSPRPRAASPFRGPAALGVRVSAEPGNAARSSRASHRLPWKVHVCPRGPVAYRDRKRA